MQGGQQGKQQDQSTPDPKVDARMKVCKDEIQKEKTSACLAKSCGEFDACVKSLQQGGGKQGEGQQQGESDPKMKAKIQACADEKINTCIAKPCDEFTSCLSALGQGGGGGQQPPAQYPEQSQIPQQQSGDQSGIPQGYSSWEAFCRANPGDSRCAAYAPQQYPLLLRYSPLAAILNFILGR